MATDEDKGLSATTRRHLREIHARRTEQELYDLLNEALDNLREELGTK